MPLSLLTGTIGLCQDELREDPATIVFLAGKPSHGPGMHDHPAGCTYLAYCLNKTVPGVHAVVCAEGWPTNESILEKARAVVVYCDGGAGHLLLPYMEKVDVLVRKGVGLALLHYAVEVPKGEHGDRVLEWVGGYFETDWSVNPHWKAEFQEIPEHPVTRGVEAFSWVDEWYYHMRFREHMEGVTPLLSALPPKETLKRPDGRHSNNPHVRAAVERGEKQHLAWVLEREDGGRGFGFTGGHYHKTWLHPQMQRLVLNAILWTAHLPVPEEGVPFSEP